VRVENGPVVQGGWRRNGPPGLDVGHVRPGWPGGTVLAVHSPSRGARLISQTEHAEPRVLDTYGLTYAFTTLFLVPGLFMIDRLSVDAFSLRLPGAHSRSLPAGARDRLRHRLTRHSRTVAVRSAVLAPLVAFTGVTIVFVTMMLLIPSAEPLRSPPELRRAHSSLGGRSRPLRITDVGISRYQDS
jgi:hypothetical protein